MDFILSSLLQSWKRNIRHHLRQGCSYLPKIQPPAVKHELLMPKHQTILILSLPEVVQQIANVFQICQEMTAKKASEMLSSRLSI